MSEKDKKNLEWNCKKIIQQFMVAREESHVAIKKYPRKIVKES